MITVVPYRSELKETWDTFLKGIPTVPFMFQRAFVEYHKDRFNDASFLIYKNNSLLGIFPANSKDGVLYSHQGLSFGGMLFQPKLTLKERTLVWQYFIEQSKSRGYKEIIIKQIPEYYENHSQAYDDRILFSLKAQILFVELSSVLPLRYSTSYSKRKKRNVKKAAAKDLLFVTNESFTDFWPILQEGLWEYHKRKTVHTLDEIKELHYSFPETIRCFSLRSKEYGTLVAGACIFITESCVHIQYMMNTPFGRSFAALDMLIDEIRNHFMYTHKWLSLGVSENRDQNHTVNEGLFKWKAEFGAIPFVHKGYKISLVEHS